MIPVMEGIGALGHQDHHVSKVADLTVSMGYCRHIDDHLAKHSHLRLDSMNLVNGMDCRTGCLLTLSHYTSSWCKTVRKTDSRCMKMWLAWWRTAKVVAREVRCWVVERDLQLHREGDSIHSLP